MGSNKKSVKFLSRSFVMGKVSITSNNELNESPKPKKEVIKEEIERKTWGELKEEAEKLIIENEVNFLSINILGIRNLTDSYTK